MQKRRFFYRLVNFAKKLVRFANKLAHLALPLHQVTTYYISTHLFYQQKKSMQANTAKEKEIRKPVTHLLPLGTAKKLAEDTGRPAQVLSCIFRGEWYNDEVMDMAIRHAEDCLKQIKDYRTKMRSIRQN